MHTPPTGQRRCALREKGSVVTEYALLIALIALVCFLTVVAVGQGALGLWTSACNEITTAIAGAPAC
jgi:Flp pilus assembly pilin Flp